MRSKFLMCAAIASLGVCSFSSHAVRAAEPKGKAAGADKKKPAELHADDKSMKKQMGWEDKVMGPDDKRAELEKIARANAINEKAAKDRDKQAAVEAAAPAPKAGPAKKNEIAIPQTAEEKKLNESDKNRPHEISPKLASEAAQAPVPAVKPADDKFIDKLLKEEHPSGRKKSASAQQNDRELDALLSGAKEKPTGRKNKGDSVDEMIKSADKGPAMPAPRSQASLPEWTKQPDIASTPVAAPPPPPVAAAKPAAKKDDGVIHVVQGAAIQPAAPPPAPAPVAVRGRNKKGLAGTGKAAPAPVAWSDPFADKKTLASRDQEAAAPPARKEPASRPAAATSTWNDPFADSPEPRRVTRRPAPAAPPVVAPVSAPKRGDKGDANAHPPGWKDPFTKAPAEPTRAPVAMRELGKGESSKWEIATRRSPAHASPAAETHATGWGVLKKRGR